MRNKPSNNGFELRNLGGGAFALVGELSFATAAQALKATGPVFGKGQTARFDLAGIERADSAGVALLIEWLGRAQRAGCELRYVHLPERLGAMARVSGVLALLPLDETPAD